jgi:hypothetical protein
MGEMKDLVKNLRRRPRPRALGLELIAVSIRDAAMLDYERHAPAKSLVGA